MNLSKDFTLEEMLASTRARQLLLPNEPNDAQIANMELLCTNVLQPLRDAFGAPIHVTSGFRSPELNKIVGGSSTSQHLDGLAADITIPGALKGENKKLFILAQELDLPFDQLIDEYGYNWIHISYRPHYPRRMILHLPQKG